MIHWQISSMPVHLYLKNRLYLEHQWDRHQLNSSSHLYINFKKNIGLLTFNGEKVIFVEHVNMLGVTIDNQLKFDNHSKEICKNVNSKTTLLKKSNCLLPKKLKRTLCKLFIHKYYCSSLFAKQSSQLNQHRHRL